jgi:hypothetical protein
MLIAMTGSFWHRIQSFNAKRASYRKSNIVVSQRVAVFSAKGPTD